MMTLVLQEAATLRRSLSLDTALMRLFRPSLGSRPAEASVHGGSAHDGSAHSGSAHAAPVQGPASSGLAQQQKSSLGTTQAEPGQTDSRYGTMPHA